MFIDGDEISQQQLHLQMQQQSAQPQRSKPYVEITEQPAPKATRYRYKCEGRSVESIPGASSTSDNKTFPTIQVVGHQGKAIVVVSCVTKDAPHRPHPHNLIGTGCKKGICKLEIPTDTMTVQFWNLGIQCVKKKDIEESLKVREDIRVDPFRTGFGHHNQPIDLHTIRLCFQVFLEGTAEDTAKKLYVPLPAVISEPIYNKKAISDLSIIKLSDCVSYVDGGRKDIILLCEKVTKDIQVRFFEEESDWEAFVDFQPSQVHKQYAIWFRTPRYKTQEVTEPVKVFIQLCRPDGAAGEPLPFVLLPLDSGPGMINHKRKKIEDSSLILKHLQEANNWTPFVHRGINPYGEIHPGYVSNVSPQSYVELEPTACASQYQYNILPNGSSQQPLWNNLSSAASTSNPQNSAFNIATPASQGVPQSKSLLLHLDSGDLNINSGEINDILNTLNVGSSLPEIGNLSFSDDPQNQGFNKADSPTPAG